MKYELQRCVEPTPLNGSDQQQGSIYFGSDLVSYLCCGGVVVRILRGVKKQNVGVWVQLLVGSVGTKMYPCFSDAIGLIASGGDDLSLCMHVFIIQTHQRQCNRSHLIEHEMVYIWLFDYCTCMHCIPYSDR
jgi:hypothetical protein